MRRGDLGRTNDNNITLAAVIRSSYEIGDLIRKSTYFFFYFFLRVPRFKPIIINTSPYASIARIICFVITVLIRFRRSIQVYDILLQNPCVRQYRLVLSEIYSFHTYRVRCKIFKLFISQYIRCRYGETRFFFFFYTLRPKRSRTVYVYFANLFFVLKFLFFIMRFYSRYAVVINSFNIKHARATAQVHVNNMLTQ